MCLHLLDKESYKMTTKNITLKVDSDIYDNYRTFCKKKGWVASRQFEIMMEEQMGADK